MQGHFFGQNGGLDSSRSDPADRTDRFGPFILQPGLVAADVELAFQRVEDAHERFIASPLSQIASRLEREVVVSGVFGTNTIEGGTLTEDETASALAMDPTQVQEVEQQRAINTCRKAAEKKHPAPNQAFVDFHLEGMRQTINGLHDRVNRLVGMLLFESTIRRALDSKDINARQYTILSQLLDRGRPLPLDELRHAPWYASLYLKRNDKTRQRDVRRLRELELAHLDANDALWPGFIRPRHIKPLTRKDA